MTKFMMDITSSQQEEFTRLALGWLPEKDNFMECIRAIRFLHYHGGKHGDVRRDHILIDRQQGAAVGSILTAITGTVKISAATTCSV
jgi:hypothetical protein